MLKALSRLFSRAAKEPDSPPAPDHSKYGGYHLLFPDSANAQLALGERYLLDGDPETAKKLFDDAIAKGGNPGIVANIHARWFYDRGDYPNALEKSQLAIEHRSGSFLTYTIGGASAYRMGKRDQALEMFTAGKTVAGSPHLGSLLAGIATIKLEQSHIAEALSAIEEALRHDPRNESALLSAMLVFDLVGDEQRLDRAINAIRRWHPNSRAGQMNVGTIALSRGQYKEGWRLREARLELPEFKNHYLRPSLHQRHKWDGSPYPGKRLLVFCEQGLGDTVMLARFLPQVKRLGGTLIVECQPEAVALLEPTVAADEWIPINYREDPATSFDLWVPSMSLPFLLGIEIDTCTPKTPYLQAAPDILAYWRELILAAPSRKFRVGIAWSGNPTLRMDSVRSMKYSDIAPLIVAKDIEFHILQIGHDGPDPLPENLIDHAGELLTLADTAALATCMDLIITVDSVLVHVAGALGLPTWLMLPDHYEWRWTRSGQTPPWYPSVRVIRQHSPGNWKDMIDGIRQELSLLSQLSGARQ